MGRITASREILRPDPKYQSLLAGKFINCLMYDGKKSTASSVFYDALDVIAEKISDTSPIEVFEQAIENLKPHIEVRSKRVGGASYQVPMQVNRTRQQSLAIRWLLLAVREKKGRPTYQKLADELMAAYRKEGVAMARRETRTAWPTPTRPSLTLPGSSASQEIRKPSSLTGEEGLFLRPRGYPADGRRLSTDSRGGLIAIAPPGGLVSRPASARLVPSIDPD